MNNLLAQGLMMVMGLKEGVGIVNTPAKRRGTAAPEELTQANKACTVCREMQQAGFGCKLYAANKSYFVVLITSLIF